MLPLEHSAILLPFIKLPFVIKIFVLFIFEWPFYTVFTVLPGPQIRVCNVISLISQPKHMFERIDEKNNNFMLKNSYTGPNLRPYIISAY